MSLQKTILSLRRTVVVCISMCCTFTLFTCNSIVNTGTISNGSLQKPAQDYFKQESLYLFDYRLGSTVEFLGTQSHTLLLNHDTIESIDQDSIFFSIQQIKDTLLQTSHGLVGQFAMNSDDVQDWITATFHFYYPQTYLLARVFRDFMDSSDYTQISHACSTSMALTIQQKETIFLSIFNAIQSKEFYTKYRSKFLEESFLGAMQYLVERLVREKIMIDTSGKLSNSLSLYQNEMMKWFNLDLVLRFLDIPTSDERQRIFRVNPKAERVFRFEFVEKSQQAESGITRFFSINSDGLKQQGYSDSNGFHELKTKQIHPFTFITNKPFEITSLFFSRVPMTQSSDLMASLLPGQAVIEYKFKSPSLDTAFYELKAYYLIDGSFMDAGKIVKLAGTVSLCIPFCHLLNDANALKTAILLGWNSSMRIQRIGEDRDTLFYIEDKQLRSARMPGKIELCK